MDRNVTSIKTLVSFMLIMVSFTLLPIAGATEGTRGPSYAEPEIQLTLEGDSVKAYVSPEGDDGIVKIRGTIFCEVPPLLPPNVYCSVQIQTNTGGWPASVPPALTFSKAQTQQTFTISIQIPLRTKPEESKDIYVTGTWKYVPGNQGGSLNTETIRIEVQPYIILGLSTKSSNSITLETGGSTTKEILVENKGTGTANVNIYTTGSNPDMDVTFDKKSFTLSPFMSETVEMTIKYSGNKVGDFKVQIGAEDPDQTRFDPPRMDINITTEKKSFSVDSIPYLIPIVVVVVIALIVTVSFILFRRRKTSMQSVKDIEDPGLDL